MNFKQGLARVGAGVGGLVASAAAMAQATPIDVTGVTDKISAGEVAIAAVGVAALIAVAGVAIYKWVRRAV